MIVCDECGSSLNVKEEGNKQLISTCEKCLEKTKEESYEEGYEDCSRSFEAEVPVYEKQMEKFEAWIKSKFICENYELYREINQKLIDLEVI